MSTPRTLFPASLLASAASRPRLRELRRDPAVLGVALAAPAVGVATVVSLQIAVAMAMLLALLGFYAYSRTAGIIGVWLIWLTVPGVRRVLGLLEALPELDPLSLVPFLATGLIAALEAQRARFDSRATRIFLLAALALAVGIPTGLRNPTALVFALTAYGSALGALAIGYAEAQRPGRPFALRTVLTLTMPALAIYGIWQYFSLPVWDENWLGSVEFASIRAPGDEDRVRIFSTMNAPGVFGPLLVATLLMLLATKRLRLWAIVSAPLLVTALALTYVRSAWIALVVALLAYAAAARGRSAGTVLGVMIVCAVGFPALSASSGAVAAFTDRITSLGELGEDRSAQERIAFTAQTLPAALAQPFGYGLGQSGQASRFEPGERQTIDNGYLAVLYQSGPMGFLLMIVAIGWATVLALRVARRRDLGAEGALLLSLVVLFVVFEASGDALFGLTGALFWYVVGRVAALNASVPGPDAESALAYEPGVR